MIYLLRAWWGATEPFRLDRTPAWITLGILLVGLPVLVRRLSDGFSAEDFGTLVLTATLIAILWTAHYTYRGVRFARQMRERDEIRRNFTRMSIAAAAGAELEWLRVSLKLISLRIDVSGAQVLDRPQIRHALENLDLFSSGIAQALSEFDALLRQIDSHVVLYVADHQAAEHAAITQRVGVTGVDILARNPVWVGEIQRMINSAQDLIPLLKKQLLSDY